MTSGLEALNAAISVVDEAAKSRDVAAVTIARLLVDGWSPSDALLVEFRRRDAEFGQAMRAMEKLQGETDGVW